MDNNEGIESKVTLTEVEGTDGQKLKYTHPPQPTDPIQFDECWTATIEKIGDELVEKVIKRMKEEKFKIDAMAMAATPLSPEEVFQKAIKYKPELEPLLRPGIEAAKKSQKDWVQQFGEMPNQEPTPDFLKDMYKMPSDDVPIPRMTPEQREQLYKKPDGYFDEHGLLKAARAREAQIKSNLTEFDKTDWQCFKEFIGREWKAAKELWKRWMEK